MEFARRRKVERATQGRRRNGFQLRDVTAVAFTEIESQDDVRIPSGVTEFDRVLGGGIVPGTLVLIGGDPGIGKSTLLLQVADKLSSAGSIVFVRLRRRVGTADQVAWRTARSRSQKRLPPA